MPPKAKPFGGKDSRAVEVVAKPLWSSFEVEHVRDFKRKERAYQTQLEASSLAPVPLSDLVQIDFAAALPFWISAQLQAHLASTAGTATGAGADALGAVS